MCVCAEGSADFLPPSPPAKKNKTTARQNQAEQPATVDLPSDGARVVPNNSVTGKSKLSAWLGVDANANTHANPPKVILFMTRYSVVTPRKKVYQVCISETDTARARWPEPSGYHPWCSGNRSGGQSYSSASRLNMRSRPRRSPPRAASSSTKAQSVSRIASPYLTGGSCSRGARRRRLLRSLSKNFRGLA
jgi:hypothetical protein